MNLLSLKEQTLHVLLPEEIDHHITVQLAEEIDEVLLNSDVTLLVFDFANTRFMDSSGIGLLIGRYRKIASVGGYIRIEGMSAQMSKILRLSGIEKIIGKCEETK